MSRSPIAMIKGDRGLKPLDAYAAQQLEELPPGEYNVRFARMTSRYKEEREGMRGLWWAGCDLLSQNTEAAGYGDKRQAHESILRGIGYVRPRYRIDGAFEMIPISTAEESMPDEEFSMMQERARAFCVDRFGFDPFATWVDQQEDKR